MPGDDIIQALDEMNAEWVAWRQLCRELEVMPALKSQADLNSDSFKPFFAAVKRWGERLSQLRDAQVQDIVTKAYREAEDEYERLRTLPDERR